MEGRNDSEISQSGLFAEIPQDKLLEIAGTAEEKVAPANTIMVRQGDPGDNLYIISVHPEIRDARKELSAFSNQRSV